MPSLYTEISELIRKEVKFSGKTQHEIATAMKIAPASLSIMLSGKKKFPRKRFEQLQKIIVFHPDAIKKINEKYEKAFSEEVEVWGKKESKKYAYMFFGADIFDNKNAIDVLLCNRDELDKTSKTYESDVKKINVEIIDELAIIFSKISDILDLGHSMYNKLLSEMMIQYQTQIKDAVMSSDIDPVVKDKVYKIISEQSVQ